MPQSPEGNTFDPNLEPATDEEIAEEFIKGLNKQTPEEVNLGVENPVVRNIAENQGAQRTPEQRYADIKAGIKAMMNEGTGFSFQDMLGRQDFFVEKLIEKKILSLRDIGIPGIMGDIVKAAREVSLEGIANVGRSKNWKKSA